MGIRSSYSQFKGPFIYDEHNRKFTSYKKLEAISSANIDKAWFDLTMFLTGEKYIELDSEERLGALAILGRRIEIDRDLEIRHLSKEDIMNINRYLSDLKIERFEDFVKRYRSLPSTVRDSMQVRSDNEEKLKYLHFHFCALKSFYEKCVKYKAGEYWIGIFIN